MLTLENESEELETLYTAFKSLSTEVFEQIESKGKVLTLKSETNLLSLFDNGAMIYIKEGYFRLIFGNKVVRLYSEQDFIVTVQQIEGVSLSSEFASEIVAFDRQETISLLSKNDKLLAEWFQLMDLENRINLGLCAHLVDERVYPSLELRQFKDRETIVEENTESIEIYEMITGQATVTVSNIEVGVIEAGEIFGEMSALVDCPRTAGVTADGQCCVRVVKKEDFFKLLEVDRHLSANLAKTLSRRIIDLNRRLAAAAK
jgi:CRP-like cAMP-binding protein